MTANKNAYYDSIPLTTEAESDVMSVAGRMGPWHLRIFIQIFFIQMLAAVHNLAMTFLAPNIDHWCSGGSDGGSTNHSIQQWKSISKLTYGEQCSRHEFVNITVSDGDLNNATRGRIVPCFSWEYDKSFYSSTLLSEWNLVCHQKWLVSLSKSVYQIGILLSDVIFGHLSDRFGRKPIIVCTSIISAAFTTLSAFTTSITLFIVVRFFSGIGLGGFYNTSLVLLMEIVVPEVRAMYGMGIQIGWCFGFFYLPGVAWFIRNSFWLQIALAVPAFIIMIFSWMIPESPRWLLSKGRVEEARTVLLQAVQTNKLADTHIDNILVKVMADPKWKEEGRKSNRGLIDLLKTPRLRRMTIFLLLIWFITSFIYSGLSYNTNELMGNPFRNFALSGAVEFPAYLLSIFIIKSVGRKRPLAATMIVGGVLCLVLYGIPIYIPKLLVAANMLGKFCITCSFGILIVFTIELFPTVVRNLGLGLSTASEGLGSIISPFVRELGYATHPSIPQFLFGVMSFAGGALVIFLPEINNMIIPDTIEDAEHLSQ